MGDERPYGHWGLTSDWRPYRIVWYSTTRGEPRDIHNLCAIGNCFMQQSLSEAGMHSVGIVSESVACIVCCPSGSCGSFTSFVGENPGIWYWTTAQEPSEGFATGPESLFSQALTLAGKPGEVHALKPCPFRLVQPAPH